MGPVCVVLPCALHGGPFELVKYDAILVAYGDEGEPVGRVCQRCTLAGEEGLGELMLARVRRLRTEAEKLERLAGEGIRLPPPEGSPRPSGTKQSRRRHGDDSIFMASGWPCKGHGSL